MRSETAIRAFLECKDGSFQSTAKLLKNPDSWKDLIPADQRRIKRYAALPFETLNRFHGTSLGAEAPSQS